MLALHAVIRYAVVLCPVHSLVLLSALRCADPSVDVVLCFKQARTYYLVVLIAFRV